MLDLSPVTFIHFLSIVQDTQVKSPDVCILNGLNQCIFTCHSELKLNRETMPGVVLGGHGAVCLLCSLLFVCSLTNLRWIQVRDDGVVKEQGVRGPLRTGLGTPALLYVSLSCKIPIVFTCTFVFEMLQMRRNSRRFEYFHKATMCCVFCVVCCVCGHAFSSL